MSSGPKGTGKRGKLRRGSTHWQRTDTKQRQSREDGNNFAKAKRRGTKAGAHLRGDHKDITFDAVAVNEGFKGTVMWPFRKTELSGSQDLGSSPRGAGAEEQDRHWWDITLRIQTLISRALAVRSWL